MKKTKSKTYAALHNRRGEGYIDTAILIIISVVIGGLLLTGLYALFNNILLPGLAEHIQNMFGSSGSGGTGGSGGIYFV